MPISPSPSDPYDIVKWYKYLRVSDVSDAMDFLGYFSIGLMSPEIRPLWSGMRFWGPAVTIRCVPAQRPMVVLKEKHSSMVTAQRALVAHGVWADLVGPQPGPRAAIRPGCVLVMDSGGSLEAGKWGSSGSLLDTDRGVVGFVTNGYIRDTYEVELHKTPMCCRARGRTIQAGRMEVVEVQTRIGCGGVQVRPGDIVGGDDDGVIVVPLEVAAEVGCRASEWVIIDNAKRRERYEALGLAYDETVDVEGVAAYYSALA
jgi:4-hydroxy-4-methyl-2-oxoglutarate aldolase